MYPKLIAAALLSFALLSPASPPKTYGDEAGSAVVNGSSHAGTEVACDIPNDLHQKNTGGSDGAGLCVFASMRHSGLWQNNELFAGIFQWMKKHPGGGYPSKVDAMLKRYAGETGKPIPDYVQSESGDLEILKLACKTGRMPGVTYGYSPTGRYGGKSIAHMVSLVHADNNWFVILDNNYPGSFEWMTPEQFKKVYMHGGGGWAVILLTPPPPPAPR